MKQLIVNADDFGRAPGVNRGIIEAHQKGIVTSTTVMINYDSAPAGLELAFASAPDLGLGLHLNLTSGCPVLPAEQVPSLVHDHGVFYHITEWASVFETFDPGEIEAELTAQFDRFVSLTGRTPDHLDSHHHASYLHPAALATMLSLANRYNLPMRNGGLDVSPEQAVSSLSGLVDGMSGDMTRRLFERLEIVLEQAPAPRWPAALNTHFYGTHATLGDLLLILTNLSDDSLTELMCHPGYVDDALGASIYAVERERELAHLIHPATLECIASEMIQLLSFGDLPA